MGFIGARTAMGDELPAGYELMPYQEPISVTRVSAEGTIRLSPASVVGLLAVAVLAPENTGQPIPGSYWLRLYEQKFVIAEWWWRQGDFRAIINAAQAQSPPLANVDFAHFWNDWKPL